MASSDVQLKLLIAHRLNDADNMFHYDHQDGVFRGLLWALTGEDPGYGLLTRRAEDLLRLAGVPYRKVAEGRLEFATTETEMQTGVF